MLVLILRDIVIFLYWPWIWQKFNSKCDENIKFLFSAIILIAIFESNFCQCVSSWLYRLIIVVKIWNQSYLAISLLVKAHLISIQTMQTRSVTEKSLILTKLQFRRESQIHFRRFWYIPKSSPNGKTCMWQNI